MRTLDPLVRAVEAAVRRVRTALARWQAPEVLVMDEVGVRRQSLPCMAGFATAPTVPFVLLHAIIGHARARAEQERMAGVVAAQVASAAGDAARTDAACRCR